MWIVLCDPRDHSALWAYEGLKAYSAIEVQLVTTGALAAGLRWDHRVTSERTSLRIQLSDSFELESEKISGVLNRLLEAPTYPWQNSREEDRLYVQQEMSAFYLSWLHALPCPVYNRPTPQGLCGNFRNESEWVYLAGCAGLPTVPYRQSTREVVSSPASLNPLSEARQTVIVVDGVCTGRDLPAQLRTGCARLAEYAETRLLGIDFVPTSNGSLRFFGATPYPDLRCGGVSLLRELNRAFLARAA